MLPRYRGKSSVLFFLRHSVYVMSVEKQPGLFEPDQVPADAGVAGCGRARVDTRPSTTGH